MTGPLAVADVLALLAELAPPTLAESWDHVGLQVGAADASVARVLVALEVTDRVLARVRQGAGALVVSHHPLLFHPLESVRSDRPTGRAVAALVRARASLVACHTNWDKAPGGSDDALASALGLLGAEPLVPSLRARYRLSAIVPEENLDDVREAMAVAGAGLSERYRRASFSVHGESTFEPLPGARPAYGAVGGLTVRAEHRLEMVVSEERLAAVERALLAAHPYEEPAWAIDRLDGGVPLGGLGRIGDWSGPVTVPALARAARRALGARVVRVCGRRRGTVRRVASVAGAGRALLARAAEAGADALVTADIDHHDARLAEELGIAVVDVGHRESEEPGVRALAASLEGRLTALGHSVPVTFVPVEETYGFETGRG